MTLAQLITDLKNMIGPGVEVDDAGLGVWLNEAYMYVVDEISDVNPDYFAKSATADTVAGQQEYDLPTDFERALMVNLNQGSWVRCVPMQQGIQDVPVLADGSNGQGFSLGVPRYYIIGDNIGFMPIPTESLDEAIKLWYVYTPSELTNSSEPAIPEKYHHILKYGAYANYLSQDDQHNASEAMRERFEDRVEKMTEKMSTNQLDTPKSIVVTQGQDLFVDNEGYI